MTNALGRKNGSRAEAARQLSFSSRIGRYLRRTRRIVLVWEARLQMLKRKPLRALFRRDSTAVLIEQYQIDVAMLPYRTEALEAIGRERTAGRKSVLLTQLPSETASEIAQ